MSEPPPREADPYAAPPKDGVPRLVRRKVGGAKVALAVVLARAITAVTFGVLSLILWGLATIFH